MKKTASADVLSAIAFFFVFMHMKIVLCFVLHPGLLSEATTAGLLPLGWSFHHAGVFESCLLHVF